RDGAARVVHETVDMGAYEFSNPIRVATNGLTAGACGSTWATACAMQHGLKDVAVSGDELWVKSGSYKPSSSGDRTASFQLRTGIELYGGFAGTETTRGQRQVGLGGGILLGDLNGDDAPNFANIRDNSLHVVT